MPKKKSGKDADFMRALSAIVKDAQDRKKRIPRGEHCRQYCENVTRLAERAEKHYREKYYFGAFRALGWAQADLSKCDICDVIGPSKFPKKW